MLRRHGKSVVQRVEPRRLTTRPTVSVVVPCYNYGRYLPAAVSSALDQPELELEIIIAENGSTDNSLEIAKELANADSRIQVLTQSTNMPYLENFNYGLRHATGKYSVLLCADDLLAPGSLTRAAALMEAHPEITFTYGHCPRINEIPPTPRTTVRSWSIWHGADWITQLYRKGRNVIWNPEVLMRASVFRDIGGYNTDHLTAPDMLLWIQAAARGSVGRINGADQGFYRIHGQNMHQHLAEGWLTELKGAMQVFDTPLKIGGVGVDMNQLSSLSRRALAARAVRYACAKFDSGYPDDRSLGDAYASFAVETWPEIQNTRRWRVLQSHQASTLPVWRIEIAKTQRRLGDYVERKLDLQLMR